MMKSLNIVTLDLVTADQYIRNGNACFHRNRLADALYYYQKALEIAPDHSCAHHNIGLIYHHQGRFSDAIMYYEKSLMSQPNNAETCFNMGNAFFLQGHYNKAIACYHKAVCLKPDHINAYYNMGNAFKGKNQFSKAISCYKTALEINPHHLDVLNNMGNAYKDQGKWQEAIECYERALQIGSNPGLELRKALVLPVVPESITSIHRFRENLLLDIERLKKKNITIDDPHKEVGATGFYLAYHGLNDKEIQKKLADFYIKACPDLIHEETMHEHKRHTNRIRLGIISNYLWGHTIGKLNIGLIENLSRDRFEVFVFRFEGNPEDPITSRIALNTDKMITLPRNLFQARQAIAAHTPDILFYLDIGMDVLTYFLAFSRLAPVQCTTWGHPVTTGIPNMDYFISSSDLESGEADCNYTEQLVCLKNLSTYYCPPDLGDSSPCRKRFGLPEKNTLYLVPQSLFKFHPDFDISLGKILQNDPKGLLVLLNGKHGHWKSLLQDRFYRTFPDKLHRVIFLPQIPLTDFFSLLMTSDAILDPFHFSGGNSSLEAFACGAPVVTWPSPYLKGRITYACYQKMGFMDLVADTHNDFIDIALRLANDSDFQTKCREKIKTLSPVLYQNLEYVCELEAFFEYSISNR